MASIEGSQNLNAAQNLTDIYANKENLTDQQVTTLKELIPNLNERIEREGSLNGHSFNTGGVGSTDREIAILFLKTFHSEEAFIDHYLGLDSWREQERAANPNNHENVEDAMANIRETFMNNGTELVLGQRELTSLPQGIGKMVYLTSVDVSNNKLQSLPDSMGNLNLYMINFSENREMTQFPTCVSQMTTLNYCYAASCSIEQLGENIGALNELIELDVSHNNLENLPNSINQLVNLNKLNVSDNQLEGLPSLEGLAELRSLNISRNNIQSLPENFANQHPHLRILDISYNQIGIDPSISFPNLRPLTRLNLLNITGNAINERLRLPYGLGRNFQIIGADRQIVEEGGDIE